MSKLDLTDKESSWFDSLLNAFSPSFRSVVSKGFSNTTWFFQKGVEKIENLGWIASTGSLVFILPAGIAIATEQQLNELDKLEAINRGVSEPVDSTNGQGFPPIFQDF